MKPQRPSMGDLNSSQRRSPGLKQGSRASKKRRRKRGLRLCSFNKNFSWQPNKEVHETEGGLHDCHLQRTIAAIVVGFCNGNTDDLTGLHLLPKGTRAMRSLGLPNSGIVVASESSTWAGCVSDLCRACLYRRESAER